MKIDPKSWLLILVLSVGILLAGCAQRGAKVSFRCQHHGGKITVAKALNEVCPGCGCGQQTKVCKGV